MFGAKCVMGRESCVKTTGYRNAKAGSNRDTKVGSKILRYEVERIERERRNQQRPGIKATEKKSGLTKPIIARRCLYSLTRKAATARPMMAPTAVAICFLDIGYSILGCVR